MGIWIERRAAVVALTPRIKKFLIEAMGGVSLDDVQAPSALRPDYSCLNGLLVVEIKSLEDDGAGRMGNLVEKLQQQEDWPIFFGAWPIGSVLANLDDKERAQRDVFERAGRAIVNHLKKADDQLAAHAAAFPRKNRVNVVILVNEDHKIYDPESVLRTVAQVIGRTQNGQPRYDNIDAVLYLTERHATLVEGKVTFPSKVVRISAAVISSAGRRRRMPALSPVAAASPRAISRSSDGNCPRRSRLRTRSSDPRTRWSCTAQLFRHCPAAATRISVIDVRLMIPALDFSSGWALGS